jgi:hypothetical protein
MTIKERRAGKSRREVTKEIMIAKKTGKADGLQRMPLSHTNDNPKGDRREE